MKQHLSRWRVFLVLTAVVALMALVPMATPAEAAPQGPTCGPVVYVSYGDTLSRIATRCGTTVQALMQANPSIWHPNWIFVGQAIRIPGSNEPGNGTSIYVVQRGDTLFSVAVRFNTTVAVLRSLNPSIRNSNWIYAGQRLVVPGNGGTTKWLTYESARHGYRIQYPSTWKLEAEVAPPGQNNDRETVTLFQPGYGVPGKFTRIFIYVGKNGYVMQSPRCDSNPKVQGVTACRSSYYGPQNPPQELVTFEKGGSYWSLQIVYERSSEIQVYDQVLSTFRFTR